MTKYKITNVSRLTTRIKYGDNDFEFIKNKEVIETDKKPLNKTCGITIEIVPEQIMKEEKKIKVSFKETVKKELKKENNNQEDD